MLQSEGKRNNYIYNGQYRLATSNELAPVRVSAGGGARRTTNVGSETYSISALLMGRVPLDRAE